MSDEYTLVRSDPAMSECYTMPSDPAYVIGCACTSSLVATGYRTLNIWNRETDHCSSIRVHSDCYDYGDDDDDDMILSCAFSANGLLLATGSTDFGRIWDPVEGVCRHLLVGHAHGIVHCAFSHDSQILATASSDHTVILWNVCTGRSVCVLKEHTNMVSKCWFSRYADAELASISIDGTIKVWDTGSGMCKDTLSCGEYNYTCDCVFTATGLLVASELDRCYVLWDKAGRHHTLKGSKMYAVTPIFSPDGLYLFTSSHKTIDVWNVRNGLRAYTVSMDETVWHIAISTDGLFVVMCLHTQSTRVWHVPHYLQPRVKTLVMILIGHRLQPTARNRLWLPPEIWQWMETEGFY